MKKSIFSFLFFITCTNLFSQIHLKDIPVIKSDVFESSNVKKSNSKYTRRLWDEVCPTIHTRNDLLASQNTIHPSEDRVYSIRELMRLMSIPEDFRWMDMSLDELNALSDSEKT